MTTRIYGSLYACSTYDFYKLARVMSHGIVVCLDEYPVDGSIHIPAHVEYEDMRLVERIREVLYSNAGAKVKVLIHRDRIVATTFAYIIGWLEANLEDEEFHIPVDMLAACYMDWNSRKVQSP